MLDLYEYFLNPAYFNRVRTGEKIKGIVRRNSDYISHENPEGYMVEAVNDLGTTIQKFSIKSPMVNIFEGMELEIKLVGGFSKGFTKEECEKIELEKQRQLDEYKRKKEKEKKVKLKKEELYLKECENFYNNLNIGVKYTPIYRVVLSGLTENSAGNGAYKNTVTHLRLEEDLTDGKRFNRKSGECLCKCKRNGKKTLWDEESSFLYDDKKHYNPITCKSCLKILKNKGWLKID